MKKLILFSVFLSTAGMAQITNPAPYCDLNFGIGGSFPAITKVELGTLINSSNHCAAPGYIYYNNVTAPILSQGDPFTIKITFNNADLEPALKGWIDYNQNNSFEPSEQIIYVAQGALGFGNNITKQATFTVPNISVGTTRMRIAIGWTFADNQQSIYKLDSCHTVTGQEYSAGEVEDYDISLAIFAGIKEAKENKVDCFPNPAMDKINLTVELPSDVSIFDLYGKKVMSFELTPGSTEKNISELTSGYYSIRISNNEGISDKKLLKL